MKFSIDGGRFLPEVGWGHDQMIILGELKHQTSLRFHLLLNINSKIKELRMKNIKNHNMN